MSPVDSYQDCREWVINELIGLKVGKIREQTITDYKTKASDRYFESFAHEHQVVLPMSKEAILTEAIGLGINVSESSFDSVYTFNPDNKLLANACMAKDCPYYLCPRNDFSAHIERMKSNPDFIHSFHRTVWVNKNKSINKIIEDIVDGKCRPGQYKFVPLTISKKILVEKYSGDVEINKDIYMSIYDN
jgi:hypothetical protein